MAIKDSRLSKRSDVYRVSPKDLIPGFNPRQDFGDIDALMVKIVNNGVMQPLKARRKGDDIIIVDGERRYKAAMAAIENGHDIQDVPVIILPRDISEVQTVLHSMLANDGKPLTATEEGAGYLKLQGLGLSVQDIMKKTGKSDAHVYNRMSLARSGKPLQDALNNGGITITQALDIARAADGDIAKQMELVEAVKEEKASGKKAKPRVKRGSKMFKELLDEINAADLPEGDDTYNAGVADALNMVRELLNDRI